MKRKQPPATTGSESAVPLANLTEDVRRLIVEARASVAAMVNATRTMLFWQIGKRIAEDILMGDRAAYGRRILATLAQDLAADYGSGFNYSALNTHGAFCRGVPRRKDCCDTVATIELVAYSGIAAPQESPPA